MKNKFKNIKKTHAERTHRKKKKKNMQRISQLDTMRTVTISYLL